MYKLILMTILLALTFNQLVECQKRETKENIKLDKNPTPNVRFENNWLKYDVYFNETKSKDRLKISKSFIRREVKNKLLPDNFGPMIVSKVSVREDLVKCDNLTLAQQDQQQLIDCRPLESYFLDSSYEKTDKPLSGIKDGLDDSETIGKKKLLYTKKSTHRRRYKTRSISDLTLEYQMYPLRDDVVDRNIRSIVADINLTQLNFITINYKLGYYIQAYITSKSTRDLTIECSGNAYLSINQTEFFTRLSNETYPEFEDEFYFILDQGMDNGFLFSLQNFICKPLINNVELVGLIEPIGMNIDFTAVMKDDFPYLTLRHNMKITPIEAIFKYDAAINQVRLPEDQDNPHKYNTTIDIKSSSGLIDLFNFVLKQTFTNLDENKGSEYMYLVHPDTQAIVTGAYQENVFVKNFRLLKQDITTNKTTNLITADWMDIKTEEFVELNFKINKASLKQFFNTLNKAMSIFDIEKFDVKTNNNTGEQKFQESNSRDEL